MSFLPSHPGDTAVSRNAPGNHGGTGIRRHVQVSLPPYSACP